MLELDKLPHDLKTLEHGDDAARRQVIQSLKGHEKKEWAAAPAKTVHSLVELLKRQLLGDAKKPSVHQDVIVILGQIGPRAESAVEQLGEFLRPGIPDPVREAAALALGRIGSAASSEVDHLAELVTSTRASLAVQAIRALGDIGCADEVVRDALMNLWQSPSHSQACQIQTAIALRKLKIDAIGVVRFMTIALAANQDVAGRRMAIEGLNICGPNDLDVVPALLQATLKDKDEEVRKLAEASLTQLRLSREKASQICAKQLGESAYAESALKQCGQVAVPALIQALTSEDALTREKATRILGSLGEAAAAAAPALTKALQSKDLDFRLAVAKSLWNITQNADPVVPVLIDLLQKKWPAAEAESESRRRFLQTVIEALWRIGPPAAAAVPALIEKKKDKNRLISESAASALKEIAPREAAAAR